MPGVPADADALRAENAGLRAEAAGLRAAVEALRVLVAGKDAVIAGLRAENAGLAAENAELGVRVARLERLVSRNSGNSSMPPSMDDVPGKKPPAGKPRRGGTRRPGKQPGAPGAYLAWNDHPDDTAGHFPQGSCACGADLAAARDLGVKYSRQVTDLPEVRARTVQHDLHEVECGCGRRHVADAPAGAAGAPGTVTYGPRVQAWCVFLMVMHHVPVQRCADIVGSLCGTRPSEGWVHALLARAARVLAAANKVIRELLVMARVVCGDETVLRAGPGPRWRKKYLHVACTSLLTCYFLGGRTLASFRQFIWPAMHGTVIVHDRYQNYDAFPGLLHQLCCAHILRDLEGAAQAYPGAGWPGKAAAALRELIHAANTARAQGLASVPAAAAARPLARFRNAVAAGLDHLARLAGDGRGQPECLHLLQTLHDRDADVLRFVTDTAVPPTSNQAERDLRPAKTQEKISGRLRSEQATRDRYAIRGYLSTAVKHGHDALTVLSDALTGNPWTPPDPAAA
jgi:transposase